MAASLQYKRGAPVGAGCVEGLCFKGQRKGSKRKVDARYAGEGYGLQTQAGCVRMRSRGDSGSAAEGGGGGFAAIFKEALRDCLPALIVILTPGEEFWYM